MAAQKKREDMDVVELLADALRLMLPKSNLPKDVEKEVRAVLDLATTKAKDG